MTILRTLTLGVALVFALVASSESPKLPVRTVNGKEYYYYEVPKKETIYSITRKFGYTRDEIIKHNPQVRDGLRVGDTLLFPYDGEPIAKQEVAESTKAVVESTIVPEKQVQDNKDLSEKKVELAVIEEAPVAQSERIEKDSVIVEDAEPVNVAVMLPFMLEKDNVTRQTENNTNFYRGMLLALEEQTEQGAKVNLHVLDTEGSADVVANQLLQSEMQDMQFIVAPNDTKAIEQIAEVADSMSSIVLNLFAVKNEAEKIHESVVQANITHEDMYSQAVSAFCKQFASKKVVILNPTDVQSDKDEFIKKLTMEMVKSGITFEQVNFSVNLSTARLAEFAGQDCVFVPTGGSRAIVARILPALAEFTDGTAVLFGYPEWVTLRGENKDYLHKLNTVIYSRFSTDLEGERVKQVVDSYKEWYGVVMPQSVPNMVLLGYDVMNWIIFASNNGLTEKFVGLQNTFSVKEIDGGGDVNTAMYFISFKSDGKVDSQVL